MLYILDAIRDLGFSMKLGVLRRCVAACATLGVILVLAAPTRAGGGGFGADEDDDKDSGSPFFGVVKDKNGNPVPDAKVTAIIASSNSTLVLRADSQGHFFIRGFDKSINPGDIHISCGKEGLGESDGVKAPSSSGTAPVEVLCSLPN